MLVRARRLLGLLRSRKAQLALAVRVTVAAVVAYAIAIALHLMLPLWAVLTSLIVTQLSVGRSLKVSRVPSNACSTYSVSSIAFGAICGRVSDIDGASQGCRWNAAHSSRAHTSRRARQPYGRRDGAQATGIAPRERSLMSRGSSMLGAFSARARRAREKGHGLCRRWSLRRPSIRPESHT